MALRALTSAAGVRRGPTIAREIASNFEVVHDQWPVLKSEIEPLITHGTPHQERNTARALALSLKGIGPKQSRNLLQTLGLTRYEIPIDSRITKWLNEFGFPVHLNATALSDESYYSFVLDGVQELCRRSGVLPCLLDAAIFVSYDMK